MRKNMIGVLIGMVLGCFLAAGHAFATGNLVPITDGTETLGTTAKHWGAIFVDSMTWSSDDTIVNTTDDEFTFASNDTGTTVRIKGFEASEAILILDADEGDDNADTYTLKATVANALEWYNHTTKIWSSDSAGYVNIIGGLNLDEELDIDFDAADEEINIKQAAVAGAGDVALISIDDDRTGATATETDEATIWIDAQGVYAIGIIDGAVAIESILDTYAAGALLLGSDLATSVEIGDAGVTTDIQGPLTILGTTGAGLDTAGATAMFIAQATATSLSLAAADIDTTILGPLNVLEATGKGIDTTGAGALFLGEAVATSVSIGASDIDTTILGPLNVLAATGKGIDTTGAGAFYLGEAVATSVVLGASDCPTTIAGGQVANYVLKTANYTATANDYSISYTTSAITTNTLPEASTVPGQVFVVSLFGDTGDLVIETDATDKFDGAGNDRITCADAGDTVTVQATAANAYTVLANTGGTLSTQ